MRRSNGGGHITQILHLLPMSLPEIVVTENGPAITHADMIWTIKRSGRLAEQGDPERRQELPIMDRCCASSLRTKNLVLGQESALLLTEKITEMTNSMEHNENSNRPASGFVGKILIGGAMAAQRARPPAPFFGVPSMLDSSRVIASLEQEDLERKLRGDLNVAIEHYHHARLNYQAALKLWPDPGCGHPDSDEAIRTALLDETQTRTCYAAHLRAFTDVFRAVPRTWSPPVSSGFPAASGRVPAADVACPTLNPAVAYFYRRNNPS